MEPQREACQVQQLKEWIDEARKHSNNVTLAVSRDGVSLGDRRLATSKWRPSSIAQCL